MCPNYLASDSLFFFFFLRNLGQTDLHFIKRTWHLCSKDFYCLYSLKMLSIPLKIMLYINVELHLSENQHLSPNSSSSDLVDSNLHCRCALVCW